MAGLVVSFFSKSMECRDGHTSIKDLCEVLMIDDSLVRIDQDGEKTGRNRSLR